MKSIKFLLIVFMLFFLPVMSFASETDDAEKTNEIKNEYAARYEEAMTAIAAENFLKACEILTPLAARDYKAAGDAVEGRTILSAKTILGAMYFNGRGVDADATKGLGMITEAAVLGNVQAQALAAQLNLEMAATGDMRAMYNLGYMCLKGWGGKQDSKMCVEWIEKAADNGHKKSARILSGIYTEGKFGITPDKEKAAHYSSLASE